MTQKIVTEGVDLPIELAVTPGSPQPCSPAINPSVTATDLSELTAEIQAAEDESGYPTGAKFYLIMISVGLVLVLGGMDASIVAVAVPSITDHFHALHDVG